MTTFFEASAQLAATGRRFYSRNWVLGTSGNLSAVVATDPLRLTITPRGVHKGALSGAEFLEVDADGQVVGAADGQPSAETALHLEIVRVRGAGAVLHTHSLWGTILSEQHALAGGLALEGFEMLKGLHGVTSHVHREWVPIVGNDQDMARLSGVIRRTLDDYPDAHAFLLRGHGLYTWGRTIADAERHVEILEFLLEVTGQRRDPPRHEGV